MEAELAVSLEEIHHGSDKSIQLNIGRQPKNLTVKIPKGIADGGRIRLKGQGGEGINGGGNGDLLIKLNLLQHPLYKVEGIDLEIEITVRPEQAVLGAQVTILTLDGQVSKYEGSTYVTCGQAHEVKRQRVKQQGWK